MNLVFSKRMWWVKLVVCIGFAGGFLVTQPLWLSRRLYPLTPVAYWLPVLTSPWDQWLYGALFVLLAGIVASSRPLVWMVPFLCAISYLALADQSRWHPWFYWFSFMMLAIAYACYRPSGKKEDAAFNACRVILIASYLWAGLQKINVIFYFNLFPWVLSAFITNPQLHPFWSKVPFAIPILETGIGIFLLFPHYRKLAICMAIAMHLVILIFLGPFGHNVNTNIWAWNLSLLFLMPLLFLRTPEIAPYQLLYPVSSMQLIVITLFLVMPLFTFFNWWDAYPGFSLYSGTQRTAYIQLDDKSKRQLPQRLQSYINDENRLIPFKWAMADLNTPDYAEPRIYKRLLAYICGYMRDPSDPVELTVLSKPDRMTGQRHIEFTSHCPSGKAVDVN